MDILKEELKDALCRTDLEYLFYNRYRFDINERFVDEDNDSLLLYSLSDSGSKSYFFLLEEGADISLVNDYGEGCYHAVVYADDVERMEMLFRYPASHKFMNLQAYDGTTPLLLSIFLEHYESFIWLINKGVDMTLATGDKVFPAHAVCMIEDQRFFTVLFNAGVDFAVVTDKGLTPADLAKKNNFGELVSMLEKI
ncbi:MAG: hypothetical protein QM781_04880 [Chitinophagaceae bacterium]